MCCRLSRESPSSPSAFFTRARRSLQPSCSAASRYLFRNALIWRSVAATAARGTQLAGVGIALTNERWLMRLRSVAMTAAAVLFLSPSVLLADSFTFPDFSSIAGLDPNGTAVQSGNAIRLTDTSQGFAAGSFFTTSNFEVASGFTTTFQFQIDPGGLFFGSPADGIAFVIQNSSSSALGGAGGGPGGLGYGGIPNSLAIEFDTFPFNGESNDPTLAGQHVGIQSCGLGANSTDHTSCGRGFSSLPTFSDSLVHTAQINYVPGTLSIVFDSSPVLASAIDLSLIMALPGGDAFLGFTGSTGGATERARILNWSYSSVEAPVPEPGSVFLVAAGLTILAVRRRFCP